MSHGDSVVAQGKTLSGGDGMGSTMRLRNQDSLRSLKPDPSYYVEEDDYLDHGRRYAWLQGVPSSEEVNEATLHLKATFRHRSAWF